MFVPRVPELSFNCSKRTLSTAEAPQVSTTPFSPCPQFQWELSFFLGLLPRLLPGPHFLEWFLLGSSSSLSSASAAVGAGAAVD